MRRAAACVLLALGLAACGGSTRPTATRIQFGIAGGNIAPYVITIFPNGTVQASGRRVSHGLVSASTVASFSRFPAGIESRRCPGTLPDIASEYILVGRRNVTVHGSCEPAFTRLYDRLARAVGLRRG
jgi:hypothetical protein